MILLTLSIVLSVFIASSGKDVVSKSASEHSVYNDKPTVIIDAGHGGFDGGASTDDGVPEKNINLNISLYLEKELKKAGYKTIMIRTEDISVEDEGLSGIRARKHSDLINRMKVMEETDSAIFVSVHQNHFSQSYVHGTQVFYSPNESEYSSKLAQCIQTSVVEALQPDNTRQIKRCGTSVYLMYNAKKPAVLVECGFLSNYEESEKLKTDDYQRKMAASIAAGIIKFSTEKDG